MEFFADFPEVDKNFNTKFYSFIRRFHVRLWPKQNFNIFDNGKVAQFLVWSPIDFFRI